MCPNADKENSVSFVVCAAYRRLPPGVIVAILMIGGVALAVIIIILIKCMKWIIRNDCPNGPRTGRGRRRDRANSLPLSMSNEVLWDSPPSYADAVDNPAYMPPWRETELTTTTTTDSQVQPPPNYQQVLSGEFTELFWPTKAELECLRQKTVEKHKSECPTVSDTEQTGGGLIEETGSQPTGPSTSQQPPEISRHHGGHQPSSSSVNNIGATLTIDKDAVRKILRGSFRNRNRTPGQTASNDHPMITIQIFGTRSRNTAAARSRVVPLPLGASNPGYDPGDEMEGQTQTQPLGSPSRLSQTNVNIQLLTDTTAGQVSCVTINTSGSSTTEDDGSPVTTSVDSSDGDVALNQNVEFIDEGEVGNQSRVPLSSISTIGEDASDSTEEPAVPSINL